MPINQGKFQIAIVGVGCRFPGAESPEAFWTLLKDMKRGIIPVPESRWNRKEYNDPASPDGQKICFDSGGFLTGLENFDWDFFGLTQAEAERIDPQQKLALEVAWEALESACILPRSLSGSNTAVIVGVGHSDHARKLKNDLPTIDGDVGPHCYDCFAANRISYFLNLKGPSFVVNSACSSSLTAVHFACQSLRTGETDLVIAGGVNVHLLPEESISCTRAGWLSKDGLCKSFREKGDGYLRGEGCGMLILKRLEDAVAQGDPIWGVIRGGAVGHNGVSNGITVPNGASQANLMRTALRNSGLDAADIDYLEAHGTGSSRGDSTEALGIFEVLSQDRPLDQVCRIGCCKPNIGHLEASSGIAGLIKILLCMKHGALPGIPHLDVLNRWIQTEGRPFRFLTHEEPWPGTPGKPRFAGITNLAFGGANAIMFVEEAPPEREAPLLRTGTDPCILAFRARSQASLERMATAFLVNGVDAPRIHVANCHRTDFKERAVYVAGNIDSLRNCLATGSGGRIIQSSDFPKALQEFPIRLETPADCLGWDWDDPVGRLSSWAVTGEILVEWDARPPAGALRDTDARHRFLSGFWDRFFREMGVRLSGETDGSEPILLRMGSGASRPGRVILSPDGKAPDWKTALLELLASLHCLGHQLEWRRLGPGGKAHAATYPFNRKRSWFESSVDIVPRYARAQTRMQGIP